MVAIATIHFFITIGLALWHLLWHIEGIKR